jgi:glycosyltransferase involved in cell wall biosynthesis
MRVAQLRLIWRRVRPDIVNVQWFDERAEACVYARLRPLVLSCWGSDINNLFQPGTLGKERRRVGATIAKSDYVTADSAEVLKRCEELAGRRIRSKLVFYGVNRAQFKPGYREEAERLRARLGISVETKIILSPRRVHPLLGQQHILAAFSSIAGDSNIPKTALVLKRYLSASEALQMGLCREIERLGLTDRVFWLNETSYDEVPTHYAMADVVVNYPEQDALPVSFFEAAMSKKPVITSSLPAYEGVFGDAFVNVPPADPIALAAALRRVLTEPAEALTQRVKRAYSIAVDIGDQDKSVKMMVDVFKLLERERRQNRSSLDNHVP